MLRARATMDTCWMSTSKERFNVKNTLLLDTSGTTYIRQQPGTVVVRTKSVIKYEVTRIPWEMLCWHSTQQIQAHNTTAQEKKKKKKSYQVREYKSNYLSRSILFCSDCGHLPACCNLPVTWYEVLLSVLPLVSSTATTKTAPKGKTWRLNKSECNSVSYGNGLSWAVRLLWTVDVAFFRLGHDSLRHAYFSSNIERGRPMITGWFKYKPQIPSDANVHAAF